MKSIELVRQFSIPRLTLSLTTVVIHFRALHEISKQPGRDSFKEYTRTTVIILFLYHTHYFSESVPYLYSIKATK